MLLEQLHRCEFYDIPQAVIPNLEVLLNRLQILEVAYGEPLKINSGFRTKSDHISIYSSINAQRKKDNKVPLCVPLHSAHLRGCAADIADPDGYLKAWVEHNIYILEELDLWCENFAFTPSWLHVQTYPPKSKKRFYIP